MIINIENVNKSFGSKHILNNISFSVQEGEIFALIGPNGAGKTTTIRCIFGELMPESGKVEVFSSPVSSKLKERIAVMTEDRLTFKRFKGADYLKLWKMLYPRWNESIFASFMMHYRFNLEDRVETFSMGMKTLFYLALDMASGADLLILDEPTQNLDPVIRHEVLNMLHDFVLSENKTIVISSHEIYELEEIASSFAIINEGKVLYTDTIDDAKASHRIVEKGERIPHGDVIGLLNEGTLIRTSEDAGRYPNFKEIALAYLQGGKAFNPFERL
ncbi:MAG TPA: ABC transporter ATP-binding protein [Petrotogaceae bacterium]|jgi:ABC-2 type transport system ATP-binding protein|nr:ABC transporter ATP-binding protein [Petrotogaceae bacterium]HOG33710.1 ABC transporter ATP-binding protein [Petrotogaceae bacterium]HPA94303.1 ABC transporter ATP-binding protein [Petrotogaceae bacterium]HPG47517.1 ABC transporter ATP-binding protein [Petrotogaceae bacterium]HPO26843.1 ABC transporter ATP-binding protein [Petrotogaceae bacterium]